MSEKNTNISNNEKENENKNKNESVDKIKQQIQLTDNEAAHGTQYLTFFVGNEKYGISIDNVIEVIDYINVTKIPLAPEYIEGVINLRGSIIPVISLSHRFYKRKSEITKFTGIIVMDVFDSEEKVTLGLMIDTVKEVISIPDSAIDERPDFGTKIRNDFIQGVGKKDKEFIILLNTDTVLDLNELSDFTDYELSNK